MTAVAPTAAPPGSSSLPASTGVTGTAALSVQPWSRRATWTVRAIGIAAVISVGFTVWLGLWVTPPDQVMGNYVRLVYVHPAVAWISLYVSFGLGFVASLLWLWPRTRARRWDRLAAASMEVSVVYTALMLVTGSIWGRTTWGVWWAWDARLTFSALLLVLLLGYLALRQVPADPDTRARRSAIAALVAAVDVPIIQFSVNWWATLHQKASILTPSGQTDIHGSMAWTMLLGFVAFTLVYVYQLCLRARIELLRERLEGEELHTALTERQAEAGLARPTAAVVAAGVAPVAAPGSPDTPGGMQP